MIAWRVVRWQPSGLWALELRVNGEWRCLDVDRDQPTLIDRMFRLRRQGEAAIYSIFQQRQAYAGLSQSGQMTLLPGKDSLTNPAASSVCVAASMTSAQPSSKESAASTVGSALRSASRPINSAASSQLFQSGAIQQSLLDDLEVDKRKGSDWE